jgi:hypothetical protein
MRALRLAPLLLALAACTVDTASLKPRSDAECAALGQKVCGNRCMPITLENGCGEPGCHACPAPPGGFESYCDGGAPSTCATRGICPAGSAYCEGPYDTTCDDISASTNNCGACGHFCDTICSGYACAPGTILAPTGIPPTDVASDGLSFYWAACNVATGRVTLFKDGVAGVNFPGCATRIEADAYGVVLWSENSGQSIWEIRSGDLAPTLLFTPNSGVRSLALDPNYAYFSEFGAAAAGETATDLLEIRRQPTATPGSFYGHAFTGDGGLTAVALEQPLTAQSNVVVGTETGALRWLSYDLRSSGTWAAGIETPAAIAAYHGQFGGVTTPRTIVFWVGDTGNLYGKILPDGPIVNLTNWTRPSTGLVDIFADGDGVYWADSGFQAANVGSSGTYGLVGEWRAAYDDVVVLYLSPTGRPAKVAATSTHVGWYDAGAGAIFDVHK